ncbi:MAG TPA: hypothetical protein VIU11_04255, partial [Nakamurella sp.]
GPGCLSCDTQVGPWSFRSARSVTLSLRRPVILDEMSDDAAEGLKDARLSVPGDRRHRDIRVPDFADSHYEARRSTASNSPICTDGSADLQIAAPRPRGPFAGARRLPPCEAQAADLPILERRIVRTLVGGQARLIASEPDRTIGM